jgi:isocitrate dehydrogenase
MTPPTWCACLEPRCDLARPRDFRVVAAPNPDGEDPSDASAVHEGGIGIAPGASP